MTLKHAEKVYKETREKLIALEYAGFLSNWDSQTEAPVGGSENEAKQQAVLQGMAYDIANDKKYLEAIKTLYEGRDKLPEVLAHEVTLQYLDHLKEEKVPKEFIMDARMTVAQAFPYYVEAKQKSDFSIFAPYLKKILAQKREYAKYVETPELKGYDALLDTYERGMTSSDYDKFFDVLRKDLVPFVKKVTKIKLDYDRSFETKDYPAEKQKEVCEFLRDVMCFDKSRGIMSVSEHPFTSGFGNSDVRITVYYRKYSLTSSMFSTIHETGHALYEQQCDDSLNNTFSGGAASFGLHESQSRFYENMLGRSGAFWKPLYPKLQEFYPSELGNVPFDDFMKEINRSEVTFIRTMADELTYPLHIMLRYQIEKEIMKGELEAEDLPRRWNELSEEIFGVVPPNDRLGVLQDVHWAYGYIGYFPTYAYGTAIAAQIYNAMNKDFDIEEYLSCGNTKKINEWLREHIHKYGASRETKDIILEATGEPFNPQYYVDYLINKYAKVYGV